MITIDKMRICRNQVKRVRAFFTLTINAITIEDCMLLGTPQTEIEKLVVAYPGKFTGEHKDKWKPHVSIDSPALTLQITLAAQNAYAASIDPYVERLAKRLIAYDYDYET